MRFEAVTFDVDGTLYDFRELAKVFGAKALLRRRFFKAYMEAREEVRGAGEVGDVRQAQSEGIASRLGCSTEEASALTERYIEAGWSKFHRVKPIAGVRELLDKLAAADVKLGLISDYPARLKIDGLGLGDLPWAVEIAAESLGALKPHEICYRAAIEQLGVAPERTLHIGDRRDADVDGAKRIGMSAALFTGGNRHTRSGEHEPDFVFDDYQALAAWMDAP